jgi:hypothetical protein
VQINELLSKLDLIEEQARRTMDESPQQRAKERQLMIIALVKHIRWALADTEPPALDDPEATVRLPS